MTEQRNEIKQLPNYNLHNKESISIDQIREERNNEINKEESSGNCVAVQCLNKDKSCP